MAWSVLGENLWNDCTKHISCEIHIEVVTQEVSDVEVQASGKSRFQTGVDRVLTQVELCILALCISESEGSWCSGWLLGMLSIEESAIETHLEHALTCECWSTNLRIVSSDTGEERNLLLGSVNGQVFVKFVVDQVSSSRSDLLDNLWNDLALEKWDEHIGNLCNEATR